MNAIIAADPFALTLKKAVFEYLNEKGHEIIDLGSTDERAIPCYECSVKVIQALQAGRPRIGTIHSLVVVSECFLGKPFRVHQIGSESSRRK